MATTRGFVSGHVGGIAPENQSTTVGYRHQMDVVDASRALQSIGDMHPKFPTATWSFVYVR